MNCVINTATGSERNAYDNITDWDVKGPFLVLHHHGGAQAGGQTTLVQVDPTDEVVFYADTPA